MLHFGSVQRNQPAYYRICVQGSLAPEWAAVLETMTITTEQAEDQGCVTTLRGWLVDQAALLGVLNLISELNVPLNLVECEQAPQVVQPAGDQAA